MTKFGIKVPKATEADLRRLLLAHLAGMQECAHITEAICGEIVGEPWSTWREMVASNAERVEKLYEFIKSSPL